MPDYPWYETINSGDELLQGDLIDDCFIVYPNEDVFQNIIKDTHTDDSASIEVKKCNIIVLSQSCDINTAKIDSIIVCPRWSLSNFIAADSNFKSSQAKEDLRQGKLPAYHLLNKYESSSINLPFSVVDFHRIYSLPKDFLKTIAARATPRLRLLPPYREHLSQSFARYFMRVGLPMDIAKGDIA